MATLAAGAAGGEMKDVPHPFLMWTRQEAAAIRKRIETDPMEKQYERMAASEIGKGNPTMWNLFNYLVMGNQAAGEREKANLLGFIGRQPEGRIPLGKELTWNVGMPSSGDRHMRDEQTLNTLRYDVLYDELTPQQRRGVEDSLRLYIEFHLSGHKPWHPEFRYDRTSWLPNMHWPRAIGTHIMAAALKDEKLIRAMFHSAGGVKWWLDRYLSDGRFYNEEFAKYYSNIGSLLTYCEAVRRLGLDACGYGYVGAEGATVRRFLEMLPYVGYPRREAPPGGTSTYPCIWMGDAGPVSIVDGYDARGRGGGRIWSTAHMNGPVPKAQQWYWYEVGHRRWPDAHFDYFLAQMRKGDEDVYLPSLYAGLGPVDPKKVSPPPAPSYVTRGRGFAMLRAETGCAYWEGPAPAVAMQFGMYYVHYVHDCFVLHGLVAFNRMIYGYMGSSGHRGYAGGDKWRDHVRGHCGVVVDGLQAQPCDGGNNGCESQRVRDDQTPGVKYAACWARGVYPGVEQERAIWLTRRYLLDVFRLASDKPRTYDWQVLAFGERLQSRSNAIGELDLQGRDDKAWTALATINAEATRKKLTRPLLADIRFLAAKDKPWNAVVLQGPADAAETVGVRVRMLGQLGQAGTYVLGSLPPGMKSGGTSILATRTCPATVFVALHEPFKGGLGKQAVKSFERIAQDERGLAVRIAGDGINDRVAFAFGSADKADEKPITCADGKESITFSNYAYVRIAPDVVTATGGVRQLKLTVAGSPKLVVNGKDAPAKVAGGVLTADVADAASTAVCVGPTAQPLKQAETVADWIERLRHWDGKVREVAARALAELGPKAKDAVAPLVEQMTAYSRFGNKYAPEGLAGIGASAVPAVVQALGSDDAYTRHDAVSALRLMGPAAAPAVGALIRAVGDENRYVARNACMALTCIGPEAKGAVAALTAALASRFLAPDAAMALGAIGPAAAKAVPALRKLLDSPDELTKANAGKALEQIEKK